VVDHREAERQRERPPPVQHERRRLLGPRERRGPRQRGPALRAHVPAGAQQVGEPEHPAGHPGGGAGVLAQLHGDGRDAGEREARRGDRGGEHQRPAHREARVADQHDEHEQPADEVGDHGHDHGGGQRRRAADPVGADQLRATGLLLEPGVAHDEQDAHERCEQREVQPVAVGDEPLEGGFVEAVPGADHQAADGVGEQLRGAAQVLLGAGDVRQGSGEVEDEQPQPAGPRGELHAVATQEEADEGPDPGEARPHRALGGRRGPLDGGSAHRACPFACPVRAASSSP
jgi:hypothetical protein